jgi:uncharacterized peroxidase-related enzyme
MAFFPSLPPDAGVRHILQLNPAAGRALIELHTAALRTDSNLTSKDKELIAAFVSGLNSCAYCHGVHKETAAAFGVPEDLIRSLLEDFERAEVDPRLKPILEYARLLTLTPARASQEGIDAVFEAGWSERDLHDAILTVCLFNFMNRLVDGHGVRGTAELCRERGLALREHGYDPLLEHLRNNEA